MASYKYSSSIILGLAVLSFAAQNAAVAHNMFDAQMYYTEGRYRCAADELEALVREHKDTAETHYLLGNTYVCLKLLPEAKVEYSLALTRNPKGKVKEHCLNALARMGAVRSLPIATAIPGQKPSLTQTIDSGRMDLASRLDSVSQAETARREDALQKQKTAILNDAEKRAESVRQEAKARLAEYKDHCNDYWRERDTGRIVWELDPNLERQFMAPYEQEISRILEDGHRRAEGLGSGKGLLEAAASLNRQLSQTSAGKGPQLDASRSNLYMRTYNTAKSASANPADATLGTVAKDSSNKASTTASSAAPASVTMMAGKESTTH